MSEVPSNLISALLRWVASCDAQAACPPFFDFAFQVGLPPVPRHRQPHAVIGSMQELSHRVHELPRADIRRAAELLSQAPAREGRWVHGGPE